MNWRRMSKEKLKNQSKYDPSRKTIGALYNDLKSKQDGNRIEVGEMTESLIPGLVEDLNKCILSKPYGDLPFYIMIHEKKDMQMVNSILRRIITTKYRPWPEDDTIVFYHDPLKFETLFCWLLPHHTEMDNILANWNLYDKEYVNEIKRWKNYDLNHFGFEKVGIGNEWIPNPLWKDKNIEEFAKKPKKTSLIL